MGGCYLFNASLTLSKPFQLSLVKIGSDLHIFEKLAVASKENAGLTLPQLATETGADLSLLGSPSFSSSGPILSC
jgi:hypothetical protein